MRSYMRLARAMSGLAIVDEGSRLGSCGFFMS
jgi:hypothetical protein